MERLPIDRGNLPLNTYLNVLIGANKAHPPGNRLF
ncbi:hypothetical protein JOC55_001112 [Paenibacillus sacheonensis]|nr:hypothetical protein [Paenibacillus sacheonensis]